MLVHVSSHKINYISEDCPELNWKQQNMHT